MPSGLLSDTPFSAPMYSPDSSPSNSKRCVSLTPPPSPSLSVHVKRTTAPGAAISITARRPASTATRVQSVAGAPAGLVCPCLPASNGPSSRAHSTAGSTTDQLATSDQYAHAAARVARTITECSNVHATGIAVISKLSCGARPPNALAHLPRRPGSRGHGRRRNAAAVRCSAGFGVCLAPGNRLTLGIDDHSSNDGTGCEPLEPATDEPAPRQRQWDRHVDEGAKSCRGTEGKTDERPEEHTRPKRLRADQ